MNILAPSSIALVLGGEPDIAAVLSRGLAAAGLRVASVGPAEADPLDRAAMKAAAEASVRRAGVPGIILLPIIDPARYRRRALSSLSETDWLEGCERPLKAGRIAMQTAYDVLKDAGGGRIVVLMASIGMTGGGGLVSAGAVAEGMRSLAKSTARQWGSDGITVNCLVTSVEQIYPETLASRESSLQQPSIPVPALDEGVAPFIALLAAPSAHVLTGATLILDGGSLLSF